MQKISRVFNILDQLHLCGKFKFYAFFNYFFKLIINYILFSCYVVIVSSLHKDIFHNHWRGYILPLSYWSPTKVKDILKKAFSNRDYENVEVIKTYEEFVDDAKIKDSETETSLSFFFLSFL